MAADISKSDLELLKEADTNETGIAMDLTDALDVVREAGGYAVLFDQRTGEPSTVRLYEGDKTLRQYLAKRDADGKQVFGVRKPKATSSAPTIPCWLGKSSSEYAFFLDIGLAPTRPCDKLLHNETELRNHMEMTHPDEYATKLAEEVRAERDRSLTREENLAKALIALAEKK